MHLRLTILSDLHTDTSVPRGLSSELGIFRSMDYDCRKGNVAVPPRSNSRTYLGRNMVSVKQHIEDLLTVSADQHRSLLEYEQQRVQRLQHYRDMRRQLEDTFTAVWRFGDEQNQAGQKPCPEGFRKWAARFVALGRAIEVTGHGEAIRRRLLRVSRAEVPALDTAAALLLLSHEGDHEALATCLERVHRDATLRHFVLWLPYILDNLWLPEAGDRGVIRVADAPDGVSFEEFRKAAEAFGWNATDEEASGEAYHLCQASLRGIVSNGRQESVGLRAMTIDITAITSKH